MAKKDMVWIFNITEGTTDYSSITYCIVRYTERATEAEGKVQAL